jgi:myo-inositol catabolism protein IolC
MTKPTISEVVKLLKAMLESDMKISIVCFIIVGFAICLAIYSSAEQRWLMMSVNILTAIVNLLNGFINYHWECDAQIGRATTIVQ